MKLAEMTWEEVAGLDFSRSVCVVPVGATEAHGPHLPIGTDNIISEAMATAGSRNLQSAGYLCVIAPTLNYTPAEFARDFSGTVSISPQLFSDLLYELAQALNQHGFRCLAIANSHFDPTNIEAIYAAVTRIENDTQLRVVFPDVTRKPWALRLTEEFKTGACHAGCYEGSIVMAARPELVREEIRKQLTPNPISLSVAISEGHTRFQEAGGERAYFGDPADASAHEGKQTIEELGQILADAVCKKYRLESK